MRKQGIALKDDADRAPVDRHRAGVGAVDEDLPAVRRDEARDAPEQGGLAAARRTQQRENLPLECVERATVQDGQRAVAFDDVPDRDDDGGLRCRQPANNLSKASTVLPRCGATFSQSMDAMAPISAGVDGR